ncbi:thiamine pyrophosphokinase [Collariella sp. IMI 366227]|nr:thiamine pyrophosphokinase [Collariella sp. IMI 366227]
MIPDIQQDDLDLIIGDLDSLSDEARAHYESPSSVRDTPTQIIRDPDQESTDFGKAVAYIRQNFPSLSVNGRPCQQDIVAIGGLGGRVDQGVSQLHHLYLFQSDPEYAKGRMYLFSGESLTCLLKTGKHHIRVRNPPGPDGRRDEDVFGKHVGILPLAGPCRITTHGLEYDVTDWETVVGGLLSTSNHVLPETEVVEVETTGDVLFTIALREG